MGFSSGLWASSPELLGSFIKMASSFSASAFALHHSRPKALVPTRHFSILPKFHLHFRPSSLSHRIPPKAPSLASTCAEALAFLLLGALLFTGRPALAHAVAPKTMAASSTVQRWNDEVVDMCERILERNPGDVEALKVVLYGRMKKGVQGARGVVECADRLIDAEPEEMEWRLLQALGYDLMGELEKSEVLYRKILEESPLLITALHGLALVMIKKDEGSAALEMLSKALEFACSDYRVTEARNIKLVIADIHVAKDDWEEALKELQNLVNEDPGDFRPYLSMGLIYSKMGKTKEADKQYETYQALVYDEFPQKGYLEFLIQDARTESQKKA